MSNVRTFEATKAVLGRVPLLIGLVGPPGGGKTVSSLRLAAGMRRVHGGPIVLIDTEARRATKYARDFDFLHVPFDPPFKPSDFLQAVLEVEAKHKPAAIITDSLSDEHEGQGGVLDWHDEEVPRFKGNEHAAWGRPKADRKRMINGFLRVMTPLIFTFRAREKTIQQKDKKTNKTEVINIGFQPIAPAEIVYALDLVCLLPNKSEGRPTWHSDKVGEDFLVKLPSYLRPFVAEGKQLCEDMGEGMARWAAGNGDTNTERGALLADIRSELASRHPGQSDNAADARKALLGICFGKPSWKEVEGLDMAVLREGYETLRGQAGKSPDLFAADRKAG